MHGVRFRNGDLVKRTLLPGLGPLFFGILMGSPEACCTAILCSQLVGSLPLGRPGPAMTASNQLALLTQPSWEKKTDTKTSEIDSDLVNIIINISLQLR